jgi:hypothetical protein
MKTLLSMILMIAGMVFAEPQSRGKFAIILQAGNETNEGMARAVHALLYARDLAEHRYQVVLIFDGAGTGWATELRKPENPFHKHYLKMQQEGVVEVICDYCAEEFGVKDGLQEKQREKLHGDYEGHPSIVHWIEQGYQILVF